MRLAAGICVLSTGLLIGSAGGAIATADTDTSGSSAQDQSVDAPGVDAKSGSEPAASASTPAPGSALVKTMTDTLALLRKLNQENNAAIKRQMMAKAEAAAAKNNYAASALSGGATASPEPDVTKEEAVTPLASSTTEVASGATEVAPMNATADSKTNPFAPVVTPVTNAVVTVMGVIGTVPGVIAALPTSQTPVADVITSMTLMLTSVTDAVLPLASVPSDLYTLLGGSAVTPTMIGEGTRHSLGPVPTAVTSPLLPLTPARPQVVPTSHISDFWAAYGDVPAPVSVAGIATVGLSQELSISGAAPLATEVVTPAGVLPVLEHAVRALLVPASLSALAALALPGVGGLLIVCAAGIRIGYRQAKAGFILRATGILRFAGSGPFGVVRSGSLIALRRPRAARVGRPAVVRAPGFLDQIA